MTAIGDEVSLKAQERRRYARYNTSNISVKLSPSEDPTSNQTANIVDFNRHGLALNSPHNYKVGDTLSLVLADDSGRDVEIAGFVCNRTPSKEGFRCGIRFIPTSASNETQIITLLEMEQALDRLAS